MKTFKKPSISIVVLGISLLLITESFFVPVFGQWDPNLSPVYLNTSTASVGIGTSTPTQRFDITGSSIQNLRINSSDNRAGLHLQSNGSGLVDIFSPSTSDDLRIAMSGTQRFTFTAGGKLGIGTTNTAPFGIVDVRGSGLQRIYLESTNNQADMHFKSNGFSGFIIGQNTLSDFTFWDNGSASNKMVIKTNGNIGIGNSAPDPTDLLHARNTGSVNLRIESTNSLQSGVLLSSGTSNSRIYNNSQSDADIRLATSSLDRMRITSGGFVGINKTSPEERLQVTGGNIVQESVSYPSIDGFWNLIGKKDTVLTRYIGHMANASGSAIQTGLGTDVTGTTNVPSVNWYSDVNPPRDMVFNFIDTYGGAPTTEVMRMLNDGRVLIGTTSPPGSSELLQVNGDITCVNYNNISDKRFKKDIREISEALKTVESLQGVQYSWRTSEFKERNFPTGISFGLIAQEVEKVIPEAVQTNPEGLKSVNYIELIPFLIEAVKDLSSQVAVLKGDSEVKSDTKRISKIGNTLYNAKENSLSQNRPNPFSNSTLIDYNLNVDFKQAYIQLFEPSGKPLQKYDLREAGKHTLEVYRNNLSAGLYLYALVVDGELIDQKSMIID